MKKKLLITLLLAFPASVSGMKLPSNFFSGLRAEPRMADPGRILFFKGAWQNPVRIPGPGGKTAAGSPATFISSGHCEALSGSTSCNIPSLSIPLGSLIFVATSAYDTPFSVADSNSDSPSCASTVTETTNGNAVLLCFMKAGATVTSLTCNQTSPTNPMNCVASWYSPGSLTGVVDQSTGQDQPNTVNWTSGNTATLTGSSDLVIGIWNNGNTAATSTYSDGGTERITCAVIASGTSCGLTDRNVTGTTPVASSGSCSFTGCYFAAVVMTVK